MYNIPFNILQVYEEIRGRHFSNVFGFLSGKAKELQAGYDVCKMLPHEKKSYLIVIDFIFVTLFILESIQSTWEISVNFVISDFRKDMILSQWDR